MGLVESYRGSGLGFHEAWLLVLETGAEGVFRDAASLLDQRLHTQLMNWMFTEVLGAMHPPPFYDAKLWRKVYFHV